MNMASSLFGLSLYEVIKNEQGGDKSSTDGDRETRESSDSNVGRQEKRCSKEKPQKTRTTKAEAKESDEPEVLVMASELKEINKDDKNRKGNHKASKVSSTSR